MAKQKKGLQGLPWAARQMIKGIVASKTSSKEERDKVLEALNNLDLETLTKNPDALAKVMSNPSGELKNYVVNPETGDGSGDAKVVDGSVVSEVENVSEVVEANAAETPVMCL